MEEIKPICVKIQKEINRFGICSFTSDNMETIMWSHYANNHKGVCVKYSFPDPFLIDVNHKNNIYGVAKVDYEKNPVKKWFYASSAAASSNHMDIDIWLKKFTRLLLTKKSPSWQYEREVRIVRTKAGPIEIDPSFMDEISFGLQTKDEDISLIKKIASKINPKIKYSKIIRSNDDFGLEKTKMH